MNITIDLLEQWESCYTHKQHVELFAGRESFSPLEIADLENVPAQDRLWTLLHPGIFTEPELRLLACDYAQYAIDHAISIGEAVDQRSIDAVAVSRRFANEDATIEELSAASEAVREAVGEAAREASRSAVWGAASEAAWAAVRSAASSAARSASWSAPLSAALSAAWAASRSTEATREAAWGELLSITKTKLLEKQTGTKS